MKKEVGDVAVMFGGEESVNYSNNLLPVERRLNVHLKGIWIET